MDNIVVGSGIAGSIIARQLAEAGNMKVQVVERRDHIGGNCYDAYDEHGVMVHRYGPHIFHTNLQHVFEYLSKFTEWHLFQHEVVAKVGERLLPVPFNLNTLDMVYGKKEAANLEKKLIGTYDFGSRVPIMKLKESKDEDIRKIADYVYENIFLGYTMKQWGQTPEEISPEVTGRVPVVISRENGYFQDRYQGMPKKGYTFLFQNLLKHKNITVETGTDCSQVLTFKQDGIYYKGEKFQGNVIYTGALDELFDCRFGRLPYRSLNFEFQHFEKPDFQGTGVINYTVSEEFTRITEFKHITGQNIATTTIVKEYPFAYSGAEGEIPYYAILDRKNLDLYKKYRKMAESFGKFYLLGRLAEYKYYNIDAMADQALALADKIIKGEIR